MTELKRMPIRRLQSNRSYLSDGLTQREIEVLTLSSQGKTYAEIAPKLCISEDAVKDHLERVRRKLNTLNKTHSVAVAVANGIVRL